MIYRLQTKGAKNGPPSLPNSPMDFCGEFSDQTRIFLFAFVGGLLKGFHPCEKYAQSSNWIMETAGANINKYMKASPAVHIYVNFDSWANYRSISPS